MNRLFIIGNGFDLAHGLKTTYRDFIDDLIDQGLKKSRSEGFYQNELITVAHRRDRTVSNWKDIHNLAPLVEYSDKIYTRHDYDNYERPCSGDKIFGVFYKDYLMERLINSAPDSWFNIEKLFYEVLVHIIEKGGIKKITIEELNSCIDNIKSSLKKYLRDVKPQKTVKAISNIFTELDYSHYSRTPETTLILDFNYTSTVQSYVKLIGRSRDPLMHIQIHGSCDSDNIIFGYGDEMDHHYRQIEELDNNKYLRHIKSFGYGENSNYWNLLQFLNSADFNVYILGHSCGLSDRVMLNRIFERSECKKIRIFYNPNGGLADYLDKYQNISRHFNNKEQHREKVIPFDKCTPLPQHSGILQ